MSTAPSPDAKSDPSAAWRRHAGALAAWTDRHLVNRRDTFGRYLPREKRTARNTAYTSKTSLTLADLERHYRGEDVGHLVGLHSTAPDVAGGPGEVAAEWSRWGGLDIDRHDDSEDPAATWLAARTWHDQAAALGFRPLLIDSNGAGGYHLRLLFDAPVPTARVFRLLAWLKRDWRELGLSREPESFPKQEILGGKGFGNWMRLPGRHHTRDHWSRAWDGSRWLDGPAAIKRILATAGSPASLIPSEALADPAPKARSSTARRKGNFAPDQNRDAELAAEALDHLGATYVNDYDWWIKVGMTLRELGQVGLGLWESWSRSSPKYSSGDCQAKWNDLGTGDLKIGSLFKWAVEAGWAGPPKLARKEPAKAEAEAPVEIDSPAAEPAGPRLYTGDERPEIAITADFHETIDAAAAALQRDDSVFRREYILIRILRQSGGGRKGKGIKRPDGTPIIAELSATGARTILSRVARFLKFDARKGEMVRTSPTRDIAEAVVELRSYPGLRDLVGVVEAPTMRPDGSILEAPGYDPASGLLYVPNAAFPRVPDRPTREQARAAARILLDLVVDFPFAGPAHKAAWLAGLLTLLARWAIDGPCPLFLFDANAPGSGKTKLADLVAVIATGRAMARSDYPDREEEMAKVILSIALAADRAVLFDNVATGFSIGGRSLDRALTATTVKGRILGKSEMSPELPWTAVCFATGNNVGLKGDALRRVLPSRLNSPEERPEEREGFTIEGDLLAHAERNRGDLVVAGLTILRAFDVAGRPAQKLTPMDYPAWSGLIRNAVHWATDLDPAEPRKEARANDPETNARAALIAGWAELPNSERGVTAAEALKLVRENPGQYETLRNVFMEWSRTSELPTSYAIGMKLRGIRGRIADKRSIQDIDAGKKTTAWKVVSADGGPGGPGGPRIGRTQGNCQVATPGDGDSSGR